MKRIFFLTIVFALLLISAPDAFAQAEVSIYPQPDSPLQISNVVPKWRILKNPEGREINMLTVDFTVQNVGEKPVRAYTIREFSGEFDTGAGAVVTSYMLRADGSLKANQFADENLGETGSMQEKENFKLAVDFIEFTDGTIWGKDFSNSAQQFAGVKTGIRTILESLKKAVEQGGIEAVNKTLAETNESISPNEQSEKWKKGFKTGSNNIKSILKRAFESSGNKGAEIELQKYFDAYLD